MFEKVSPGVAPVPPRFGVKRQPTLVALRRARMRSGGGIAFPRRICAPRSAAPLWASSARMAAPRRAWRTATTEAGGRAPRWGGRMSAVLASSLASNRSRDAPQPVVEVCVCVWRWGRILHDIDVETGRYSMYATQPRLILTCLTKCVSEVQQRRSSKRVRSWSAQLKRSAGQRRLGRRASTSAAIVEVSRIGR